MNIRSGWRSSSASVVGPSVKPPSSATSLGDSPSRCSSVTVCGSNWFSTGLPGSEAAGRISPRAPRLVFGVTSAIWVT
jgi:hypothetical protein